MASATAKNVFHCSFVNGSSSDRGGSGVGVMVRTKAADAAAMVVRESALLGTAASCCVYNDLDTEELVYLAEGKTSITIR